MLTSEMIFGAVTAQIAAEFADILPGDLTAKASFLVRELLVRLPENSVTVTCSTSSDRGLLEVSGPWHALEKTHDILRSWVSVAENKLKGQPGSRFAPGCVDVVEPELKPELLPLVVGDGNVDTPDSDAVGQRARVIVSKVTTEAPGKSPRKRGRPRKQLTMATEKPVAAVTRQSKRTIKPRSFSPTPIKKTNCSKSTPRHNHMKEKGANAKQCVKKIGGDVERSSPRNHSTHKLAKEKFSQRRSVRGRLSDADTPCSVSGVVKWEWQCRECKYCTTSSRSLNQHHKRMHMSHDFTCDQCDKTFGLKKDLVEHKHWHKKEFSCDYCHKKMAKAYLLERHISQQHQDMLKSNTQPEDDMRTDDGFSDVSFTIASVTQQLSDAAEVTTCDIDPEVKADSPQPETTDPSIWKSGTDVDDKEELEEEEESWFGESPVKCTMCSHQTTSKQNLRYHMQRMHMERTHECSICGKKFGFKKDLSEHQRWHSKTHMCTLCSKKFATSYLLNSHLVKRHGQEVKTDEKASPAIKLRLPLYGCEHCSYITKFSRNFRNHLYRHHIAKTLQCQVCSKMFALPKDLKQHMVFHTNQVFPCDVCGKKLRSKFALKVHTDAIHKGIRNRPKAYLCTLCGKLCRNITAYKYHQNREHLHMKPYACDTCGVAFHGKASLKMHKLKHTNERNFPCKVCGKAFKGQQSLNAHQLIHRQVRPFECETCKKGFTQKAALVRHNRIHTGERPYRCKLCKSTFNDNSILRRHVMGIHKITNGKLRDVFNWSDDQEQPGAPVTPSEVVIEIWHKPELDSTNSNSKVTQVMAEASDNTPAWSEHPKTESTPQISELAEPQEAVGGQTADILMPSSLKFCSDSRRHIAPSSVPCQSDTTAEPGIVDIAATLNSNVKGEGPATTGWELCSVTSPSHIGVEMSSVDSSVSSIGLWERSGGAPESASGVLTVVEEKEGFAWDSQVVPSASNETIVYAPLSLDSEGVYILVSDMSTTGETAVTLQDTQTGQQ